MRSHYWILLIITLNCAATHISYAQSATQDTVWHVQMKPVNIKAQREWANDTVRYHYNQTKYYITTILPYLNEAVAMHNELQTQTRTGDMSRKQRRAFLKAKEKALRNKFDTEIKKLNETQGVLLVKLIARQTGENIYHMLLEYKSAFTATKWLGWGALHGFNLNKQYDPYEEPLLEDIMESLNYPLPDIYYKDQILTSN